MTDKLKAVLETIRPTPDLDLARRVRARLDSLTKPPGSLGELEEIALRWCLARGEPLPAAPKPAMCVFCADHGVARRGVSAYPPEVTAQMALNFARGGAAVNVLCRRLGVEAKVVDVGVASDAPLDPAIVHAKVRPGTADFVEAPAMTQSEAERAVEVGLDCAAQAVAGGATLLLGGEMGIGNTTSAAALAAALTGVEVERLVGRGTGLDEAGVARKTQTVRLALERRAASPERPLEALAAVGGLEIAALTGYYLGGAARRTPSIVDGFIASAAALVATRLAPAVRDYLFFAHRSAENGHGPLLDALTARPLLALDMRLGEGSGAALAAEIIDAAARLYLEMATFDEAGVSSGPLE